MGPITYTFEELTAHKESGKVTEAALENLRKRADEILEKPTLKVTDIKLPRPSGDPHDYVSIAPYRWPNPDTKDGLPWISRDGYVNPDTVTAAHPGGVYTRVITLALAAFYFDDKKEAYAECASRQMYDWFINPETKINPNAKYAQALPGINEGRASGLIAFSTVYNLFNGIGILDSMGLMDAEILSGVKSWFSQFVEWIMGGEYGMAIYTGSDNHSSWISANLLATAIFTERKYLTRFIAQDSYAKRIRAHIAPDGSQPVELKRTKGIGYSFYNLHAMFVFSNLAERLGYTENWGIDKERGVCILKSAVDYLYPYVINPESFPFTEIHPGTHRTRLGKAMLVVAKRYPDEEYAKRANELLSGDEDFWLEPLF